MEETERPPRYRWVVMGLWSFCNVSAYSIINTLGILLPAVASDFNLSPGQQGLLGSAAFWGGLALTIPLGWWVSRFSPKSLTTVTMALGTLLLLLQAWAPWFAVLLVGRLIFGITPVAREPARAFLIRQWFPQREIVLANGVFNLFFGVVVGAGLLVTPFILGGVDNEWRRPMYIFAGFFAVLTVLWMVLGRERPRADDQQAREASRGPGVIARTLKHRDLWVAALGFLGADAAWAAFVGFYPTLMLDSHGLSLRWSGGILAVFIITGGVSGVAMGYAVMTGARRRLLLMILGLLMAGTYVGMTLSGNLALLLVLSFLNGIAWGFWPILYSVPFFLPGIRSREVAIAMAFLWVAISGGTVIGPLLTGYLHEFVGSLRTALVIAGLAPLLLVVVGIALRQDTEQAAGAPAPA